MQTRHGKLKLTYIITFSLKEKIWKKEMVAVPQRISR
jgi:ribosomal protein L31E